MLIEDAFCYKIVANITTRDEKIDNVKLSLDKSA